MRAARGARRDAEDPPSRSRAGHHPGDDHRHPVPRRRPQQLPARRARDRFRGRGHPRGRVDRRLLGGRGAGGGGGAPRGRAPAAPRGAAAGPERGPGVGRALGPRRCPGHPCGRRGLRGPGRARDARVALPRGQPRRPGRGRPHRWAAGGRGRARLPARDPGRVAGASHADPASRDRRGDAARSDRGGHARALRDGPGAHEPGLALRHARRHHHADGRPAAPAVDAPPAARPRGHRPPAGGGGRAGGHPGRPGRPAQASGGRGGPGAAHQPRGPGRGPRPRPHRPAGLPGRPARAGGGAGSPRRRPSGDARRGDHSAA